jgi:histidine triad (HIT) family protein
MTEPDFEKMTPQEIAAYQRQNCIFCKIIKGEIPARKVFEDDKVLSILDLYPSRKGHMLIMPKEHYPVLPAVPKETVDYMFRIARGLSKAGKAAVVTDKSTVFIANGGVAGQQSPHFLFHLIPRENGDGLDNFTVLGKEISQIESEKIQPVIKQRMRSLWSAIIQPPQPGVPVTNVPKDGVVEINPEKLKYLARMIHDNRQLRELIIKDPDGFKREINKIPDMKELFSDIDVRVLAEELAKTKV